MMIKKAAAGSIVRAARVAAIALAALGMSYVAAEASELKIPRDHPAVALDVPDNWSVDRSTFAVEMTAPEKNSIVLARVLADRAAVDTWTKEAGEKLKTFGVQFDANAKAPPTKPDEADKSKREAEAEKTKKKAAQSAFTTSPDAFTFSGAPSLKTPGTEGSNKAVKPADNSIEALTAVGAPQAAKPKPKLPFHAVQIFGASMNGKPVDVQLVIYTLPTKRLFVMMQESGSDDGRAVSMAQSVRGAD